MLVLSTCASDSTDFHSLSSPLSQVFVLPGPSPIKAAHTPRDRVSSGVLLWAELPSACSDSQTKRHDAREFSHRP